MLINKKTLFVHIPRTAGRYVGYLLEKNGHFCYHNDHLITWRGRELTHLTFPEHEVYLLQSPIKKFTIIREPVDRCISTLTSYAKVNDGVFYVAHIDELCASFHDNEKNIQ